MQPRPLIRHRHGRGGDRRGLARSRRPAQHLVATQSDITERSLSDHAVDRISPHDCYMIGYQPRLPQPGRDTGLRGVSHLGPLVFESSCARTCDTACRRPVRACPPPSASAVSSPSSRGTPVWSRTSPS